MDVEIHLKFKSGTADLHLNSLDVKALIDAGLMKKVQEAFSNLVATINLKSDVAPASQTKEEQP